MRRPVANPRFLASPTRSRRLAAVATLLAFALLSACGRAQKKGGMPPAPVTVAESAHKDVPIVLSAIGTVQAYNSVSIKPLVGGEITRIAIKEGQDVKKGDVLFVIDPRPYEAALQQAQGILARDKAQLVSAEAQAKRYADLVKKDYITKQDFDNAVAAADALRSSAQADEAAVQAARLNLGYCTVRAPIPGRTSNLLVQLGNVIKANDVPVLVLNQITPIYVNFSVPESELPEIRRQQASGPLKVSAVLPSGGATFEGELSLINNTVDPNTGMILLKATFPNEDKALWPGSFVQVSLTLGTQKGAVVVPDKAVQEGQQGTYLFVVKPDRTVEMRPVTVGQRRNDEAIIEKGLQAGEEVVTDGQLRLFPGAKVEIKSGPAPTQDAGSSPAPGGGK
ncbi:MAG: efflux RND transporter periplasmic adaptor subunit [Acidobacteriota bacterium]